MPAHVPRGVRVEEKSPTLTTALGPYNYHRHLTFQNMILQQSEEQKRSADQLEHFFSPEGVLSVKYGGKPRWSQSEMAQSLNRAFYEGKSLLVEAPTGTGKTLAYLIPIAYYMKEHPRQRFVISVATKHLQSQIEQDLQRFSVDFPELKNNAVLKGAANYLCLNRLKRAGSKGNPNKQVHQELEMLIANFDKLERLPHGWREELPAKINDQTWMLINGEGTCCKMGYGCYRKQARKLATDAKIVVVNSDLLGYNVKFTGKPIPGKAGEDQSILILDEAHTFPGRLTEVESADLSFRALENAVHALTRDSAGDNLMKPKVQRITSELENVRRQVLAGPEGQQVVRPEDPVGASCKQLVRVIRDIKLLAATQRALAPNDEVRRDYEEMETRLQFASSTLEGYLEGKLESYVMLLNRSTSTATGATALNLELKPFELVEPMERLWGNFKQVTLVSATLIGTSIPETRKTFNAADFNTTNFPSPFHYNKQMRIFLPPRVPAKGSETDMSAAEIAEHLKRVSRITDGRVMALFTNYKTIAEVTQIIAPWCRDNDTQLYAQERNISPERMVNLYRNNPKAIILGNQSMGTGVDIRLRALVITKIPFEQQSPYRDARQEFLKKKGVNPFRDDTLPEAVRKWKQWWGRLIREEEQRGMLVLLDPKLSTKSYASEFIRNLPSKVKATQLDDPAYPMPTHEQFMEWVGATSSITAPAVPLELVID
jgi:ATP-dependent DNA helicase DinG